ncbi:MAG TPA: LPS export ABC transporter periplasmic protein LptC, partial [Gemmatimonadales bacterium]|nr:LPS export ABC transporter periplasmic protein LptC [Gemmatimonadales bacterium]
MRRARGGRAVARALGAAACAVLAACEPGIKPTATISAADSADQVLLNMSHYVTDDGILRARVRADTAYFYTPVQTAELRAVHITFYDARGAPTSTLTGRDGTYHWRSGDMEARGNVVVVR